MQKRSEQIPVETINSVSTRDSNDVQWAKFMLMESHTFEAAYTEICEGGDELNRLLSNYYEARRMREAGGH